MSIDTRGFGAAEGLRAASRPVDAELMLADLHRVRRARNRFNALAATVVVVLVAVVGGVVARDSRTGQTPTVVPLVPSPTVHPVVPEPARCAALAGVTCLGDGRRRLALTVPLTAGVPSTFWSDVAVEPSGRAVFFARLVDGKPNDRGVWVIESAVPLRADPTRHPNPNTAMDYVPDTAAGTTAASVARWLTGLPYLQQVSVSATEVGGYPAYVAEFRRNPSYSFPRGAYIEMFSAAAPGDTSVGPDLVMNVRCWLVDLPRVGLTVIWSQTWDDRADLEANQALVDSLRFEP